MWKQSNTTKHTCGGVKFGKKTPGCARCDELLNGASPVQWKLSQDAVRVQEIRAHFASTHHRSGKCGVVCTFGEH